MLRGALLFLAVSLVVGRACEFTISDFAHTPIFLPLVDLHVYRRNGERKFWTFLRLSCIIAIDPLKF